MCKKYYLIYRLYSIPYGTDFDAKANPGKFTMYLGQWVYQTAILNDSLVVYYSKSEEEFMISIFTGDIEQITIEPSFQDAEIESFSYIEETGDLLCLASEYEESKCFFWKISNDRSKEDQKIAVDEETYSQFKYPYYFVCKGCHELIWYDVSNFKYTYCWVPSPIIAVSTIGNQDSLDRQIFKGVVDLGDYFTTLSIDYSKSYYDGQEILSLDYNKIYIKKIMLPKDKLINHVAFCQVKTSNGKHNASVLQFVNYLVTYSSDWKDEVIIKSRNYKAGEIVHCSFDYEKKGLFLLKEGGKRISYHPEPLNFDDKQRAKVVFQAKDPIKSFKVVQQGYNYNEFYVVEGKDNIKKCLVDYTGDDPTYSNAYT